MFKFELLICVKMQENIDLQFRFLGFLKKSPHPAAPRVATPVRTGSCASVCHSPRPSLWQGAQTPRLPSSTRLDPGEVRVTLPGPAGRQLSIWGSRVLCPLHLDAAPAPVTSWIWLLNLSFLTLEEGVTSGPLVLSAVRVAGSGVQGRGPS